MPVLQPGSLVLSPESIWRRALRSSCFHPLPSKGGWSMFQHLHTTLFPFSQLLRQQIARGRGDREEGGLGTRPQNLHFIAWLFFQLYLNRTASGYWFRDVELLYRNIVLWQNRTVSGYCPVTWKNCISILLCDATIISSYYSVTSVYLSEYWPIAWQDWICRVAGGGWPCC